MKNRKLLGGPLALLLLPLATSTAFSRGEPRVAVQTIKANKVPEASASVW